MNYRGGFSWGAVPFLLSLQPCLKQFLLSCCWSKSKALLHLLHQKWASFVLQVLPFQVSGFGLVWVLFDPCRLGLHLVGKYCNQFSVCGGWVFPFISWQFMLFSWAVSGSFSSGCSFSIISSFGELISYSVNCT